MSLNRQDREKILDKVVRLVEKKHFDPSLNGVNWQALVEGQRHRILDSAGQEDFEHEVHGLVSELKTSHTGFFHQSSRSIPARHAINATFQRGSVGDSEKWIFQDVHEGGPAQAAGLQPGDVLLRVSGRDLVPPGAPVFKMGDRTEIVVLKRDSKEVALSLYVPPPRSKKRPISQPRPVSFSAVSGRIGLLKITMFPGLIGVDLARAIDDAVEQARQFNRLIVDLRGNTGGGIGGLRLMSYLTPDKVPVGFSLTRRRLARGYDKQRLPRFGRIPSRKAKLIWLALRYGFVDKSIVVVTEGLGPQPFHGRVVLLVNQHSASAAEIVAGFAAENRLAKIVGTRTAGRLLSGSAFKVGQGYILGLPVANYLTWQETVLEGKGVTPDEEIQLSYGALREGRDSQMERALEVVQGL